MGCEIDTAYKPEHWPENQNRICSRVIIEPNLRRGFFDTPLSERSDLELKHWFGQPFVVLAGEPCLTEENLYEVYCIDGDGEQPITHWGAKCSLDEAVQYAASRLSTLNQCE